MFPEYPLFTKVFFWAVVVVLGLLGWGLLVVLRGYLLTTVLRWCTSALQGLTRLGVSCGLGAGLGSAHWACAREIRRSGLLAPGPLPLAAWRGQTLCEALQRHVLVLGPSGSRKSYGALMGMLRTWDGNTITTDLKGELWEHTHGARAAYGKVWRFAPTEADSCNLDVLSSIDWGTDAAYGQVERLAKHLLQPPKQQKTAGFEDAAGPLLVAAILHCHDLGREGLPGVIAWALDPAQSRDEKLTEMLQSTNEYVQQGARGVLDESVNMRGVVWANAWKPLALFRDKVIASHTRTSDIDWHALSSGPQPQSLYLVIPAAEIARCGAFLGCLVEALLAILANPATPPRHQTLLCLDELANCGYLDQLEKALSYLRSAKVQVVLAFQSILQVLDVYGPSSPLLASVHTLVAYSPTVCDDVTGEWLSRRLGVRTTWAQTFGATDSHGTSSSMGLSGGLQVSGESLGGQMSWGESHGQTGMVSQSQVARSLLLPDELRRLDEETALLISGNCAPVWAQKFPMPGAPPPHGWHLPRLSWKWGVTCGLLAMLGLASWPIIERARLILRTATLRQTTPVQPWERDPGKPLDLQLKDMSHEEGAKLGLPPVWNSLEDIARRAAYEAAEKRHPRAEEDKALGRKPASLLEEEARNAQLALFPEKAPRYQGTWTVRQWVPKAHLAWRGPGHARDGSPWRPLSQHPTQALCMTALAAHTEPLIATAERVAAQSAGSRRVAVQRDPWRHVWNTWPADAPDMRTVHEYRCEDRPFDLPLSPGAQEPLLYVGLWRLQAEDARHFGQDAEARGLYWTQDACEAVLTARYPHAQWRPQQLVHRQGPLRVERGVEQVRRAATTLQRASLPQNKTAWCQPPAPPYAAGSAHARHGPGNVTEVDE